jgi:hypothetical protein
LNGTFYVRFGSLKNDSEIRLRKNTARNLLANNPKR